MTRLALGSKLLSMVVAAGAAAGSFEPFRTVGLFLWVLLASSCAGGQTTQPGTGVCEPDLFSPEEKREARELAMRRVEGVHQVPFHWHPSDAKLPALPASLDNVSSTELRLEVEYAGTDEVAELPCSGELLPFVVSMDTEDQELSIRALAFAIVDPRYTEKASLQGGWSELRPVLEPSLDDADEDVVQVPIRDAELLDLPWLNEVFGPIPEGPGNCSYEPSLSFDDTYGAHGTVCVPELGRGVWPEACGGVRTIEAGEDVEGGSSIQSVLDDIETLVSVGEFSGMLSLSIEGVAQASCLLRSGSSLAPARVALDFFGTQRSEEFGVFHADDEHVFVPEICSEVENTEAMAKLIQLGLDSWSPYDCDFEHEPQVCESRLAGWLEQEALLEEGIAAGSVCLSGDVWREGESWRGQFETGLYDLRGTRGTELQGIGVGIDELVDADLE